MPRYVEGSDRDKVTLLPECLDDYIAEDTRCGQSMHSSRNWISRDWDSPGQRRRATDRPAYHPGVLLKIYIYGYLNRVASSRRLERKCQRNVELMWLTGRLAPDFKTIADFRREKGGKPSWPLASDGMRLCGAMQPQVRCRPELHWPCVYGSVVTRTPVRNLVNSGPPGRLPGLALRQ